MKGFLALFAFAALVFLTLSLRTDSERVENLRELVRAHTKMQAASISSNLKTFFVVLQSIAQNYNPRERTLDARAKEMLSKQNSVSTFQIHQFDAAKAEYQTTLAQGEIDSADLIRLREEARDRGVSVRSAGPAGEIYFAIRYGEANDPNHFLLFSKINAQEVAMQLDPPSGLWQQTSVVVGRDGQKILSGATEPSNQIWKQSSEAKSADGMIDVKSERGEIWSVAHADLGLAGLRVITTFPLSTAAAVGKERTVGLGLTLLIATAVYGGIVFFINRKKKVLTSVVEQPPEESKGA